MRILVTGGTGYIGSHTCVELLAAGHEVFIVDNLSNSKRDVIDRIQTIGGKAVALYVVDLLDKAGLQQVFLQHHFDAVIHFAGLKAVGESVEKPLLYYHNNVGGTLNLLEVMQEFGVKKIVFSSSATVYGTPKTVPIQEDFPLSTTNPYGSTKLMIESILQDLYHSDPSWSIVILRYFNPIGAHASGLIGENPNGIPNNLMPFIVKVANKELPRLNVFGNDYPTKDGTGVRDYIHVVDLALGHLKALKKANEKPGVYTYNLGTGIGYSVLDIVRAFQRVNQIEVPYQIGPRRPGDIAECYADPTKALQELGWVAEKQLDTMCYDSWHFIQTKK